MNDEQNFNEEDYVIDIKTIDSNIQNDIEEFNFENNSLNVKLRNAYYNQIMKKSSTNQILFNGRVVGYYMIGMTSVEVKEDEEENIYYAIDLKILGVDIKYQRKKIGTNVLKYIIGKAKEMSEFCGCRYLVLDAVKEKIEWYKNRGFICFDESHIKSEKTTLKMYIDFKDEEVVCDYFEEV